MMILVPKLDFNEKADLTPGPRFPDFMQRAAEAAAHVSPLFSNDLKASIAADALLFTLRAAKCAGTLSCSETCRLNSIEEGIKKAKKETVKLIEESLDELACIQGGRHGKGARREINFLVEKKLESLTEIRSVAGEFAKLSPKGRKRGEVILKCLERIEAAVTKLARDYRDRRNLERREPVQKKEAITVRTEAIEKKDKSPSPEAPKPFRMKEKDEIHSVIRSISDSAGRVHELRTEILRIETELSHWYSKTSPFKETNWETLLALTALECEARAKRCQMRYHLAKCSIEYVN